VLESIRSIGAGYECRVRLKQLKDRLQAEIELKSKAQQEAQAKAAECAKIKAEYVEATQKVKGTDESVAKNQADRSVIYGLISLLGDKEPSMRTCAVKALKQMGGSAVQPLINALQDEYWIIRQRSAEALGLICDPRAVEPLIAALTDNNVWVRLRSVEALGQLNDKRAVDPLIDALSDKDKLVRRQAAKTLGQIGDNRAIDPLKKTLEDENQDVRRAAAGALESIRGKTAMKAPSTASNVKRAGFITGMLIDKKIYLGAGLSVFLPLVGLTIIFTKRRKRISAQISNSHWS
jgi:HEAT repeat protein